MKQLLISILFLSSINAVAEEKIGVLVCLTGSCSEWGNETLKGIQLATDEINASGGINGEQIKLIAQDSREDNPLNTVTEFKKILRDPEIKIVIGPTWSPGGLAIAPIAKNANVVVISASLGVKEFNEAATNLFNVWPHDEYSSRALARKALKDGYKTAGIMSAEQPWSITQSKAFTEEFAKGGGKVVALEEPLPLEVNLRSEATRIIATNPAVVFIPVGSEQLGVTAKLLKELGSKAVLLSPTMDDYAIKLSDGALHGAFFATSPEADAAFSKSYQAKYAKKPGTTADRGYDAIKLYAAVSKGKKFANKHDLSEALLNNGNFIGATGPIVFDAFGGVIQEPEIRLVTAR